MTFCSERDGGAVRDLDGSSNMSATRIEEICREFDVIPTRQNIEAAQRNGLTEEELRRRLVVLFHPDDSLPTVQEMDEAYQRVAQRWMVKIPQEEVVETFWRDTAILAVGFGLGWLGGMVFYAWMT